MSIRRAGPSHRFALLGGAARDYCECYATSGVNAPARVTLSLKERARAAMEAGYRAFRMGAAAPPIGGVYDTRADGQPVVAGPYLVHVRAHDGVPGPELPLGKQLLPPQTFSLDVPAQDTQKDFNLPAPPGAPQ